MIVCLGTTPTLARTMEFSSVTLDGVNRALAVREYAAGKAINAARAITTLGSDVLAIGPAGGATGDRLKMLARSATTSTRWVNVEAATRLCLTVIDRAAKTSTELIEDGGPLTAAEGERLLHTLVESLPGARICVLAGSLAKGIDPSFYAKCIEACRAAGVTSVLDASGPALLAAIAQQPDVVKVNAGELASVQAIAGDGESAIAEAATALARQTRGWVIVTRGRHTTLAMHADRGLAVSVPDVDVVSAIGSGDSFTGACAVGLEKNLSIEDALRLATAGASANAMTADAAHFDAAAVAHVKTRISIERR